MHLLLVTSVSFLFFSFLLFGVLWFMGNLAQLQPQKPRETQMANCLLETLQKPAPWDHPTQVEKHPWLVGSLTLFLVSHKLVLPAGSSLLSPLTWNGYLLFLLLVWLPSCSLSSCKRCLYFCNITSPGSKRLIYTAMKRWKFLVRSRMQLVLSISFSRR